jgi:tetratricopeptide (TPR) repeat protein
VGDLLHLNVGRRRGLLRGTSATAWYELGLALEATDPGRAMTAYERALAGRPDFADAHNNLGRLHHDQSNVAVAESHYRLALCCRDDVALYWFNLGVSVEDRGRVHEAIAAYDRALEIEPTMADAHFNLARLLEVVGRKSADELVLRRAVRHLVRYRDLARAG